MNKLFRKIYLIPLVAIILSLALFYWKTEIIINTTYASENKTKSSDNNYYSKYKFISDDKHLNIGVQPLYLPAGIITEVMRHDLILRRNLSEMGINISFYLFLKGVDVNQFFQSNDLQAGVAGDIPTITMASKKDIFIPAIMQVSFCSIVTREHVFIQDLRGKRIAYPPGSTAHYTLLTTLAYEGITQKDVKLVPMEITDMPEALSKGDIFAFSAWEPIVGHTERNYPGSIAIHKSLTFGYIYFSREYYIKHPEVVRQVVAAEIRAVKWIKSSRENLLLAGKWVHMSTHHLVANKLKITPEQIADIAINDMMWLSDVPVIPEKSFNKNGATYTKLELLKKYGQIDSTLSFDKLIEKFDRTLIYDILSHPDKYELNDFNYAVKGLP